MAIIKYGPLASEVRGSIGGTTFSRSRAGAYVRKRTKPVFSNTKRRTPWLSRMPYVYHYWLNVLTDEQRQSWNTMGDNTEWTNALGETYHPSGYNLWLRAQTLLLEAESAIQATCPGQATGTHYPITYTHVAGDDVYAEMQDAPALAHKVLFWASYPLPWTVYSHRGPYPQSTWKTSAALHAAPVKIFDSVAGHPDVRYFIRDRAVYDTAHISAAYFDSLDLPH